MSRELYWVHLNDKREVVLERISTYNRFDFHTVNGEKVHISKLNRHLPSFPSTNGLYTLYACIDYQKVRIHVCTEEFMTKYYNDQAINTMTANPNVFYRGKHVNIKTFVKKQLLRALIPSEMNDIHKQIETYEETFKKDLSSMSVVELKKIISNKGFPSSNLNKEKLIQRLLLIYKMH